MFELKQTVSWSSILCLIKKDASKWMIVETLSPKPKFLALHYPIEGDSHFGTAYLFRADSIMKPILVISVISIWLNCIKYLFQAIFNIIFVYWNSNQTVLNELPTNWFSPLSWLISWPLSQVGTMSFLFWYSITNYVANVTVSSIL